MCVFHLSWGLQDFVIKHFDHVATSDCPEPGSFHSKLAFVLELSTGKLQTCKKTQRFWHKFLKFVPASIRSPQFIKNWVLFRKHRILQCVLKAPLKFRFFQNPGAQNLTPMVQWSFFLILNLKFVTLKHIFNLSSELHGFLPDKMPTKVILRTVGAKLREKLHFKGWAPEESFD